MEQQQSLIKNFMSISFGTCRRVTSGVRYEKIAFSVVLLAICKGSILKFSIDFCLCSLIVHVNVCALCKFSILIFMILPWLLELLLAVLYFCNTLLSFRVFQRWGIGENLWRDSKFCWEEIFLLGVGNLRRGVILTIRTFLQG